MGVSLQVVGPEVRGAFAMAVAPGTVSIVESPRTGWQVTSPTGGSYSVTVATGTTVSGQDFGNRYSLATISGTVWNDQNGSGTRDTSEPGLPGWLVFADTNGNGSYDEGEAVTVSGRDGSYQLAVAIRVREYGPTG